MLDASPEMTAQPLPLLSQRLHAYVNATGAAPTQVPFAAVRVEPSVVVPEIVGTAVLDGAPISGVAADAAWAVPSAFDAVTVTRTLLPLSAFWRTYVAEVAPPIATQLAPFLSQRLHE